MSPIFSLAFYIILVCLSSVVTKPALQVDKNAVKPMGENGGDNLQHGSFQIMFICFVIALANCSFG